MRKNAIEDAKLAMVDEFFSQLVYGVKFSEVFRQLDCLDANLAGAFVRSGQHVEGLAVRNKNIVVFLNRGKDCKQTLEKELQRVANQSTVSKRIDRSSAGARTNARTR
ncbi:MAG: hypothetical protein ACYDHH_15170 [Solirubrobacteraceae bacterium]